MCVLRRGEEKEKREEYSRGGDKVDFKREKNTHPPISYFLCKYKSGSTAEQRNPALYHVSAGQLKLDCKYVEHCMYVCMYICMYVCMCMLCRNHLQAHPRDQCVFGFPILILS